jgi:hypothetical protein
MGVTTKTDIREFLMDVVVDPLLETLVVLAVIGLLFLLWSFWQTWVAGFFLLNAFIGWDNFKRRKAHGKADT